MAKASGFQFVEKPDQATAEAYVASEVLLGTLVFLFRARTFYKSAQ